MEIEKAKKEFYDAYSTLVKYCLEKKYIDEEDYEEYMDFLDIIISDIDEYTGGCNSKFEEIFTETDDIYDAINELKWKNEKDDKLWELGNIAWKKLLYLFYIVTVCKNK